MKFGVVLKLGGVIVAGPKLGAANVPPPKLGVPSAGAAKPGVTRLGTTKVAGGGAIGPITEPCGTEPNPGKMVPCCAACMIPL